ncbi:hypothetical protein ACLMJK_004881 [Lecanora helva]
MECEERGDQPLVVALKTLLSATDTQIMNHWAEASEVCHRLCSIRGAPVQHGLPVIIPCPTQPKYLPTAYEKLTTIDKPPEWRLLMQALDKNKKKIKQYFLSLMSAENGAGYALKSQDEDEDPYIVDQTVSCGNNGHDFDPLRRVLSSKFLAHEYDRWQHRHYGVSKIEDLLHTGKTRHSRPSGSIPEFVQEYNKKKNVKVAAESVRRGIKLVLLEKIVKVGHSMVSALVAYCWTHFRDLRYDEIKKLAAAIEKKDWIMKFAAQYSAWFEDCQKQHDAQATGASWTDDPLYLSGVEEFLNSYPSDGNSYPSDGNSYPSDGNSYPSDGGNYYETVDNGMGNPYYRDPTIWPYT